MIVCPSCQKANAGNPTRCEFCGMSFNRLTDDAKADAVANARKNTRMTKNGFTGIGIFAVSALVCNLPESVSSTALLIGCIVFGAIFGFPIGYALSVINGDAKKGAILGAVVGVLFGLVLAMMNKDSVLSLFMLRGIASGAIGGLVTAQLTRRQV